MTFNNNSANKQTNQLLNSITKLGASTSLVDRIQQPLQQSKPQLSSRVSQYFNVQNKNFSNTPSQSPKNSQFFPNIQSLNNVQSIQNSHSIPNSNSLKNSQHISSQLSKQVDKQGDYQLKRKSTYPNDKCDRFNSPNSRDFYNNLHSLPNNVIKNASNNNFYNNIYNTSNTACKIPNTAYKNQNAAYDNGELFLNTRGQKFKESKVQQSLQKAFSLHRNSQRIPFKKKQNVFIGLNYPQGQKAQYNFYQPKYEQYYVKQEKNFWAQALQKFNGRGSLQNLDYPSFQNNRDESKSTIKYNQLNKTNETQQKKTLFVNTKKISESISKQRALFIIGVIVIIAICIKRIFN